MLKRKFQLAVVADFLLGVLEKLPQVVVDKQRSAQNAPHPPHEHLPCRHMLTETSTQRFFKPIKSFPDAGLDAVEELKVRFFSEL